MNEKELEKEAKQYALYSKQDGKGPVTTAYFLKMKNLEKNIALAMKHAGYTTQEINEALNHELLNLTEEEKNQALQKLFQHEKKKANLKIIKNELP